MATIVSKSTFKPQALKYFREIEEHGQELIITDHTQPVIKIIPYRQEPHVILRELRKNKGHYPDTFRGLPGFRGRSV
ncbi:MAG: type II toxin-antitoxin system Phd/YefM family antitoxin [Thermodesulfobacteriota bacterium]|nr:type II toxin-antitoxin system Phd/YefM family antitoxin [Thermodesulfobacteriota bacterium]